ncbi:TPA: hypothetical protein U2I46_003258 [Providencia stuartii]|nr:hypothetical protein [Providencia stuartii]MBG5909193.1 hypothetical protein [Providencia stuartii]HAU5733968.1 hypothetical protein [Providencia stuartii]HAU5774836.1 hypothetical protein [Providencia stuartii]HEM6895733.1 hypothetical protein [Providencia stuartii]
MLSKMKKWLASLFKKGQENYPVVWNTNITPIYQHLLPWINELSPLPESLSELPDTTEVDENTIRWANGAEDGVFSHHGMGASEITASEIYTSLKRALEKNDKESVYHFYQQVAEQSPLSYIDDLIHLIVDKQEIHAPKLEAFTDWLLHNSPDTNVVKLAISFTVFFPSDERLKTLYCLACHDEFTLYTIIPIHAMLTSTSDYDAMWLKLAKRVEGWGRVHLIEHLPDEISEETKQWILTTGYQNSVMVEYTAWHCATYCHLADALETQNDSQLLVASSDIIQALLGGGPARDINDYDDAFRCCFNYLSRILEQDYLLDYYFTVLGINDYFQENSEKFENSTAITSLAQTILDNPIWDKLIAQGLNSDDDILFRNSTSIARARGQDIFPYLYEKQLNHPENDLWFELMKTNDIDQVKQVIALAEQQLPLEAISTGPSDSLGLGAGYAQHGKLDFILQELPRFPGVGLSMILCGLQSPVVRNRNMALRALANWKREDWPQDLEPLLTQCHAIEPDNEAKARFAAPLRGEPLED